MPQMPIIRRTEKVREVISRLKERKAVYIAAFFYSGKTVLLDQISDTWDGNVLHFRAGLDDWESFHSRVTQAGEGLVVIDGIDHLSEAAAEKLTVMLADLSENQYMVLSGRAQMPPELYRLCSVGYVEKLDREFMMFDAEEIVQLFLEYGIELLPSEVRMIQDQLWGWVFGLHMLARKILKQGKASFHSLIDDTRADIKRILVSDVFASFTEQERQLMYNLSPFDVFSEDMARLVTGRIDAPRMMEHIAGKSYMLLKNKEKEYAFIPIVRQAVFSEMCNLYSREFLLDQYKRAALYYELQNEVPRAISYYKLAGDMEKIRELLIRDTYNRPAEGDYVDLREAYALLDEETILSYPELIKGKSEIACLQGRAEESDRWYAALEQFIRRTPARDVKHQTAEDAKVYLDLCLSHRGSKHTLSRLIAVSRLPRLMKSAMWQNGFNVSGNSVSLINGGLDFCRWVPNGWNIYRLFKKPIELALGRSGSGVTETAIAERELEANPEGDYSMAMLKIREGLQRAADNLEITCAATGIQSRIEAARGNVISAVSMIDHAIASLPPGHPKRLKQNLEVFRLYLKLLQGDIFEARSWLETKAPDETGDFVILDRYSYLLKLRMYIILGQREKVPFLAALLRQYFETYDRPYMLIQLNLLEALFFYRTGNSLWRGRMEEAVTLANRYSLVRVIADEGIAVIDMLGEMSLPGGAWAEGVLALTRKQAAFYPGFMKSAVNKPVFTDREYQVYSLMLAGWKNAKIASILGISERTVKHFCGLIYKKLGVESRAEALSRAAELGDIK